MTAVTDADSRLRLVITLRADLYDRPLQYADFGRLLRAHQETVLTLAGHEGPVIGVAFHPEGDHVATAGADGTAALWPVADLLASGETESAAPAVTFAGHEGNVVNVAFSEDGRLLATGGVDAKARLWDVAGGEQRLALAGHGGPLTNLAFSPDGRTLAGGSLDGTVRAWDVTAEGGREWLALAGHRDVSFDVRYSADGRFLATASFDGTASIWDATTGERLQTLMTSPAPVAAAVFSPDGQRLATASFDGTATLWDAASGELLLTLAGHQGPVVDLAFHPDGRLLATAGKDGTARL